MAAPLKAVKESGLYNVAVNCLPATTLVKRSRVERQHGSQEKDGLVICNVLNIHAVKCQTFNELFDWQ